jgi:arylsulfatase
MLLGSSSVVGSAFVSAAQGQPALRGQSAPSEGGKGGKPNIVVIFGDDIGVTNLSCYSFGMMGYRTPNIDRIAKEGMMFTDYYAEQSCTAGRSAFITGQSPLRTGLSKVGIPSADIGLRKEDPTIAEMLKPLGYATGQFGKNHLGDRDEFLPTAHGFDEFYGNLYHLFAEEEPEYPDYPKDPEFRKRYGPRGVIHSFAGGRIEDTGPLTSKRMETIDDDIAARSADFIGRQVKANKPFFLWVNFTHMHMNTHPKSESVGQVGPYQSIYHDVMIDHDKNVGAVLDKLDELGIADNTIVLYTTDNGAMPCAWPDGATTPFRGEKNTNWEGGYRAPAMIRWPGKIEPGAVSNEIVSSLDWFQTFLAAAGVLDVKEKLLAGFAAGATTYRVHLDGYNLLPYLTGKEDKSPRDRFFYISDDGDLLAVRLGNFKMVFEEQRATGMGVWLEPFTKLRIPKLFNLRTDPFERADTTSSSYYKWWIDHVFLQRPTQEAVRAFVATFKDFPPRQRPASLTVDQILERLKHVSTN